MGLLSRPRDIANLRQLFLSRDFRRKKLGVRVLGRRLGLARTAIVVARQYAGRFGSYRKGEVGTSRCVVARSGGGGNRSSLSRR